MMGAMIGYRKAFAVFSFLCLFLAGRTAAQFHLPQSFAKRSTISGTVYYGDPANYLSLLNILAAGDTLLLAPGTYSDGLPIYNMNGTAENPIVIAGPPDGPQALFVADPCICTNTIGIQDASYIEIHNLELDGRGLPNVDAVKAEGSQENNWAHHITLQNLTIHDHDANQQTVGISTKIPAWDWVIRGNIIDSVGTGIYLGNSDGGAPFMRGLIEGNLIVDTIGYNMQIKHQNARPILPGMPVGDSMTIIRHNVFSKAANAASGADARPNLLVGHWPLSGVGVDDVYLIYGNFFYQNPTVEPLFQGEGNVALYQNLFVSDDGDGVAIQPHNDVPRMIRIFNNTALTAGTGIRVTGGDTRYQQHVIGNAVFAANPLQGGTQLQNVSGAYAAAANYLANPFALPGQLDLYPLVGLMTGPALDTNPFDRFLDWNRDFNGDPHDGTFRGAYAAEGQNAGWLPRIARKPLPTIHSSEFAYLPLILQ